MNITASQITNLSIGAAEAGDLQMWAICWVAAHGAPEQIDLDEAHPTHAEFLRPLMSLSQAEARAKCAKVIVDAAAMAD